MIAVTYCSESYQAVSARSLPTWLSPGAADEVHVYSDCPRPGPVHELVVWHARPIAKDRTTFGDHCTRKAESVRDLMQRNDRDPQVVLLDADCFAVRSTQPVFADNSFDVAVPVHNRKSAATGGVLFLRRTAATLAFLDRWVDFQSNSVSRARDVWALDLALKHADLKVKRLPASDYNNYVGHNSVAGISAWLRSLRANRKTVAIVHASAGACRSPAVLSQALAIARGET